MRRLVVGVLVYSVTSLVAVAALGHARLLTGTVLLTSLTTNLMMALVGMGTVLGLACLGLVVVGVRHLLPFMCPRCEQPFFHGLAMEIGFVRNCVHCGIAVGTPESSGEAEQPLDVE